MKWLKLIKKARHKVHHKPRISKERSVQRLNLDRELEALLPISIPWKKRVVSTDLFLRKEPHQAAKKLSAKVWKEKLWRLPMLGLRSQVRTDRMRKVQRELPDRHILQDSLKDVPAEKSICVRRAERREQLFKMRVAGRGLRRSPGQGGHYRRTENSELSCRR